jgi:hypothetical protein
VLVLYVLVLFLPEDDDLLPKHVGEEFMCMNKYVFIYFGAFVGVYG